MQKSSVATIDRAPVDTSVLDGIANAWTEARGADASALGNLKRYSAPPPHRLNYRSTTCLLYTSDAADE